MSATLELPALITSGNKNNQVRAFIMTWPGQDKNTNITADFVPGRNLSSISQELYKIKWPRVNVQKNSFKNSKHQTKFRCSGALDTTFDTQARQLLEVGNTACERRDIQNHISGDFVWFLYLIRICVWPLGGAWIRYHQQLFIPSQERPGWGIHNINNIRCRRSPQSRTMINIAFCFQAWGFQFLQATESENRKCQEFVPYSQISTRGDYSWLETDVECIVKLPFWCLFTALKLKWHYQLFSWQSFIATLSSPI